MTNTMIKKEAKLQVIWGQYLRSLMEQGTPWYGYFELKQTDKDYMPFSALEENQLEGLPATEKNGLYWKYSDLDMRKKPCDCSCTPPLPSYVVIAFSGVFYAIRIGEIIKMIEDSRTRITKVEAEKLCERVIHI
jgi:hypothetical protein